MMRRKTNQDEGKPILNLTLASSQAVNLTQETPVLEKRLSLSSRLESD